MSLFRRYARGLRSHSADALYTWRCEWLLAPRTRRRLRGVRAISLNVGAGRLALPGFVNLDRFPAAPGVLYWDFRKPLPLSDGSVRHVHCEHFIEYLERDEALALVVEFQRVLEPGGTLRLICPDAERYFRAYCDGDAAFFASLASLGGAEVPFELPIDIVNQMFRMGGSHRWAWDFASLSSAMTRAGLIDVRRSGFAAAGEGGEIDGRDDWRRIESIQVVARKPAHPT
jgi:hypothetical protein